MNTTRWIVAASFAVYAVLLITGQRKLAGSYLKYLGLSTAALIFISPFIWLFTSSIKDRSVLNEYLFLPPPSRWSTDTINLSNFRELFKPTRTAGGTIYFWQYLANSLILACAGTLLQLVTSSAAGYALARYRFKGQKVTLGFMLASMMLPGMLLVAPTYKLIVDAGFVDTYFALLVPGAISVYGVLFFRQAMLGIPKEMIEAGRIDGCSELGIYMRLIMPIMRPVSAAFCLSSFLGAWNNYLGVNVFIQDQRKLTIPVVMKNYMTAYDQQTAVYMAGTLIAIIPPAIVFFALQKEFISGLSAGAVKG